MEQVFRGRVSDDLTEFLKIVVTKERYGSLKAIFAYFTELVRESEKMGTAYVDTAVETLKKRYEANGKLILTLKDDDYVSQNIKAFSKVNDISVVKRGPGGVADEMVIVTDKGTFKVISEYNIRAVLCDGVTKVVRQDGSEVAMPNLLPSAFFVIEPSHDKKNVVGYNIIGGGFGHGVGMSQNGAKNMALQGLGAEQILNFFYEGCEICSGQ